jgi:hypothetical protein
VTPAVAPTWAERAALRAAGSWTRAYTAGLPAPVRAARRAELAADLHDHLADLRARAVPGIPASAEILTRLARGMPDDVVWALTTVEDAMPNTRTLALGGWAYALVMAVLGLFGAVAGLAEGWRELPQHWWSALAAAGVAVALAGLLLTVTAARNRAE